MTNERAQNILQLLMDGIDPNTGEILPDGHVCTSPSVMRAFHAAILAMSAGTAPDPAAVPTPEKRNAGRPWTDEDLVELERLYLSGMPIEAICAQLQRRDRGLRKQLQYLGLIESEAPPTKASGPERAGMPWTRDEDKQLKLLFQQQQSVDDIAQRLRRSAYSIFCRMEKLGCYGDVPGYPQRSDSDIPF